MPEYLPNQPRGIVQQSKDREGYLVRKPDHPRQLKAMEQGWFKGELYLGLGEGKYKQLTGIGNDTAPRAPVSGTVDSIARQIANEALTLAGAHHARHENSGADELSVAGLSGLLADAQTPLAHNLLSASHGDTTAAAEADGKFILGLSGKWAASGWTMPSASPASGQVLGYSAANVAAWVAGMTNPMTTLGDMISGGVSGAVARLAGDTSDVRKFLRTLSVAGVAQAPAWDALAKADVGLGSVDNVQQMPLSYLDTDGTMAANSDSKVPSQKAVVTYVGAVGGAPSNAAYLTNGAVAGLSAEVDITAANDLIFGGKIGLGITPTAVLHIARNTAAVGLTMGRYGDASGPTIGLVNSGGTIASPSETQSGSVLGNLLFMGIKTGGGVGAGCGLIATAAETYTGSAAGSYLDFYTTPIGSITRALALKLGTDKTLTLYGNLVVNALNIQTDTTTGMKLATSPSQKLATYGITPIVQQSGWVQTYPSASLTIANMTASDPGAYSGGAYGLVSGAAMLALVNTVRSLVTDVTENKKNINALLNALVAFGPVRLGV